ncbi:MAG: arylesterase [Pedobacter sp.]|nr:arylesterase [Pedobacter sp.]
MDKPAQKHILFFGDSLTAGYGLSSPNTESFPALLKRMAAAENLGFSYTNAGISGDTTQSAIQRLPKLLKGNIDIAVIGIGANDILRGYPPETMTANIEKIIQQIRLNDHRTRILLLGMELPAWISHQRVSAYRDIYSNLAGKYELSFLPFMLEGVIGNRSLNLADLVHPNAKGYEKIARAIWPLLKQLL